MQHFNAPHARNSFSHVETPTAVAALGAGKAIQSSGMATRDPGRSVLALFQYEVCGPSKTKRGCTGTLAAQSRGRGLPPLLMHLGPWPGYDEEIRERHLHKPTWLPFH